MTDDQAELSHIRGLHAVRHAVNKIIVGALQVFAGPMANEDRYLAWDFEQDVHNAFRFWTSQKVDGIYVDFPKSMARFLDGMSNGKDDMNADRPMENTAYWVYVVIAVSLVIIFCPCSPLIL